MDLSKLTGGGTAIPEELMELIQNLVEGRVTQFAICAELEDDQIWTDIQILDPGAKRFTFLGGLEMLKDDYKSYQFTSWNSGDKEEDE